MFSSDTTQVVAAREAEDPTFDSSKAPRKAPQEEVIEVPSNESFVDSKQKARDGGDDGLDTENLSKTMKDVKARASSDTEDLSEMVKIKRSETEVKKEDSVKLEKDAQPPEINEVTTSKSKELTDETPIVEVKSEASPSKIAEIPTAEVSTNLANSSRSDNETEVSAARIKEVCPISMVFWHTKKLGALQNRWFHPKNQRLDPPMEVKKTCIAEAFRVLKIATGLRGQERVM